MRRQIAERQIAGWIAGVMTVMGLALAIPTTAMSTAIQRVMTDLLVDCLTQQRRAQNFRILRGEFDGLTHCTSAF